ncbi:PEP-CTERM sorting domain-containing protein [Azohydromonas aeria]|uniref:PEP-CTERM sorting domain-containing protein n=1 Tax=Azohydromonas aeria TaxID=2590212 RepID=UPI0012FB20BF|nr:PEP-CTERM sorting domain-containing protein [Azohydromonas aeria]
MASGVSYSVDPMTIAASSYNFYRQFTGNDSKGINNLGLEQELGTGWMLAAKDNIDSGDDVANVVDGVFFHVDAGAKAASGHWTLTGSGDVLSSGPILMDMVAVLKSSTVFSLYYFQNVAFDGSGGGTWLSPSLNDRHVFQDLSHMSVYVRPGSGGGMSQPGGGLSGGLGGGAGAMPVPEPGSLALASLGLVALGWVRRKSARRG